MQNKEIRLASRPTRMPTTENFQVVETDLPPLKEGEVLLRTLYLSVDPYLRGRMREGRSYVPPFQIGDVIVNSGLGEIVESRSDTFKPGDLVTGMLGWRLYNSTKAEELRKIDTQLAPLTSYLGVLGITGLTAYFGLLDIGQPQSGEAVVVSGAAGAVGMTVCQIAKIKGCRAIGIAGGDVKTRYLKEELGVDAAIDYRSGSLQNELHKACPHGIDIYFDNVGGDVSDAVLPLIRNGARIILCGQISMYNLDTMDVGLRPQPYLLVNNAMMQGFIITKYMSKFEEGIRQLTQWLAEGKLKHVETIAEGFENTPKAFIGLFTGENLGKQLVKVADND